MRCVIAVVLFFPLYFGSCKALQEVSRQIALSNGHSPSVSRVAAAKIVTKYHPVVMVLVALFDIFAVSLPWLMVKMNDHFERRNFAEQEHYFR